MSLVTEFEQKQTSPLIVTLHFIELHSPTLCAVVQKKINKTAWKHTLSVTTFHARPSATEFQHCSKKRECYFFFFLKSRLHSSPKLRFPALKHVKAPSPLVFTEYGRISNMLYILYLSWHQDWAKRKYLDYIKHPLPFWWSAPSFSLRYHVIIKQNGYENLKETATKKTNYRYW